MWEYLAVLLLGFWLGVAIFLYVSCFWLEEILDLPQQRSTHHVGASGAHAQLKRLIARVVEEAAALPALASYAAEPHTPSDTSTYEDLLANAILNKVIERYQTESGSGGRSSGIHSASASPSPSDRSSPRSINSRNTRDITPPLRADDDASDWEEGEATDEVVEVPRRVPFPEYGGDIVHASDNEFRDFDEVSGSDIQAVDGTWEENWLFQKKKIKNMQSAPVPMLVPNSNTQYRALIGDRDADDTTDLSDNASDNEEPDVEYKSDIKKVLDSKHVIGGKPKIDETLDFEPDSLMMIENEDVTQVKNELTESEDTVDSGLIQKNMSNANIIYNDKDERHNSILVLGVNSGPLPKTEFNLKEEIHRTVLNGHAENDVDEEIGEDSIEASFSLSKEATNTLRSEREKSYEETEAVPVQRYADSLRRKHFDEPQQVQNEQDDLIPGSIADRERKKWLNYVEMPNNPYSPEAIKKRLSTKSTSSLFDSITSKKEVDEKNISNDNNNNDKSLKKQNSLNESKLYSSVHTENIKVSDSRSMSPSHRVLKDVVSEEIPQYKRYDRDYYIKEARSSSGERKKNSFSGTSSLSSSINKSTSLENFDREFAPVSASSSLSDLEGIALHTSINRNVFSPRHASPNFAINPIFENPDTYDDSDEFRTPHFRYTHNKFSRNNTENFEGYRNDYLNDTFNHHVCSKPQSEDKFKINNSPTDADEINDVVRLKIPNKPEITDHLFEKYADLRSNTMRSERVRKRRPDINIAFGGSVRLKSFHGELW